MIYDLMVNDAILDDEDEEKGADEMVDIGEDDEGDDDVDLGIAEDAEGDDFN